MSVEKLFDQPEIYAIKVPLPRNPLRDLNCYVIRHAGQTLVIDTGFRMEECRTALLDGLAELGLRLQDTALFLTHLHSDHTGLCEMFLQAGCHVYMSRQDLAYFQAWQASGAQTDQESYFRQNGFPAAELKQQVTSNAAFSCAAHTMQGVQPVLDGESLQIGGLKARCVLTPGHTPGHTCLYLPEPRVLFAGDHILYSITPNIAMWAGMPDPLGDYLASLHKIAQLPFTVAFPAHRDPHGEPRQRIRELQRHHFRRLEEAGRILLQYPGLTGYQLASHMTWSIRCKGWDNFPVVQKWFAVSEALAHAAWLEQRGCVESRWSGGLRLLYPTEKMGGLAQLFPPLV